MTATAAKATVTALRASTSGHASCQKRTVGVDMGLGVLPIDLVDAEYPLMK
jgi:hypothetical protein